MTLIIVLGSFLMARLLFRRRLRHAFGPGCARAARFGGPINLGAPDSDERFGFPWGRRARLRRRQRWGNGAAAPAARSAPFDVAALELNARQQQLFDEVVERARPAVPARRQAELLAAVGAEPFDHARVQGIVGTVEVADDFEHLHHSLTPEQRAKLRQLG